MYRSIIHNDNPIPVGIHSVQCGDELIFDKRIVRSGIYSPRIHFASDIAIQCHCWEDAEVGMVLKLNWIGDYAAFGSPTICTGPSAGIDARFIKENDLVRGPPGNLSNPGISEYLISLCCFLCKLILASDKLKVEINLLMRDAKFLEDNAESPDSDCNIVSVVDFSEILIQ
jgi:hypothetical protein